jgi:hypothetical protein
MNTWRAFRTDTTKKLVAQLWYTDDKGNSFLYSNKFYSKVKVAMNIAKKRNTYSSVYYFVKVFELKEIQYDFS